MKDWRLADRKLLPGTGRIPPHMHLARQWGFPQPPQFDEQRCNVGIDLLASPDALASTRPGLLPLPTDGVAGAGIRRDGVNLV